MNTDPIDIAGNNDFLEHVIKSRTPVVVLFCSQYSLDRQDHVAGGNFDNFAKDLAHKLAKHTPPIQLALCKTDPNDIIGRRLGLENCHIASQYGLSHVPSVLMMEYGCEIYSTNSRFPNSRGPGRYLLRGQLTVNYIMSWVSTFYGVDGASIGF